ncbi:hypothetical protein BDV19DRAFT_368206 [Aspergillus venezuelensis]
MGALEAILFSVCFLPVCFRVPLCLLHSHTGVILTPATLLWCPISVGCRYIYASATAKLVIGIKDISIMNVLAQQELR